MSDYEAKLEETAIKCIAAIPQQIIIGDGRDGNPTTVEIVASVLREAFPDKPAPAMNFLVQAQEAGPQMRSMIDTQILKQVHTGNIAHIDSFGELIVEKPEPSESGQGEADRPKEVKIFMSPASILGEKITIETAPIKRYIRDLEERLAARQSEVAKDDDLGPVNCDEEIPDTLPTHKFAKDARELAVDTAHRCGCRISPALQDEIATEIERFVEGHLSVRQLEIFRHAGGTEPSMFQKAVAARLARLARAPSPSAEVLREDYETLQRMINWNVNPNRVDQKAATEALHHLAEAALLSSPSSADAHCTKCGETFTARSIDEETVCPSCGCWGTSEPAESPSSTEEAKT
jgi:hypothetical protein